MKRYNAVEYHNSANDSMWFNFEESETGLYVKYNGLKEEILSAIRSEGKIDDDSVVSALNKLFNELYENNTINGD